jgi:hypothetical protein
MFLKELKCYLYPGEFMVLCNFAENYSFILQGEAQGFQQDNEQDTVHPLFVIYFKKLDALNIEYENLVMISECLIVFW